MSISTYESNPEKLFKLPKDAKRLKRISSKKIGNWCGSLRFDATREYLGIRWYRVRGGFAFSSRSWHNGHYWAREDWVADLEGVCLSVNETDWKGSMFDKKPKAKSWKEAARNKVAEIAERLESQIQKHQVNLNALRRTQAVLKNQMLA